MFLFDLISVAYTITWEYKVHVGTVHGDTDSGNQIILKADHINYNNSNKMIRTKVKTSELCSFFIFLFDVANLNMTTLQIKLDNETPKRRE